MLSFSARFAWTWGICCLWSGASAFATEPANAFTSDMVLQQGVEVPVWGTAQGGEKVTVSFAGQTVEATADPEGRWMARLAPMEACAEGRTMTIAGASTVRLDNVVVGEVWLCAGQSNMGATMREYKDKFADVIAAASDPLLRSYTVPHVAWEGDQKEPARWAACSPETVESFSATAYFFGKNLREARKTPVGVIVCAWGGTLAECWLSRETLGGDPELAPILTRYEAALKKFPTTAEYKKALDEHAAAKKAAVQKRQSGAKGVQIPKEPMGARHFQRPAGLYYTMFQTIVPFAVKGILWYQGESNIVDGRSYQYRFLLSALIRQWRNDLQQGALPFLIVEMPTIKGADEDGWAELRDSQSYVAAHEENTALIGMVDLGEYDKLHPSKKDGVGARAAQAARSLAYGEKGVKYQGPTFRSMQAEDGKIALQFDHVGSGLVAKGGKLEDFTICGADRQFVPAEAEIRGDEVVVWAKGIEKPVAVRYGWKNWFVPTLYNEAGIPAPTFRTDDFPLRTQDAR